MSSNNKNFKGFLIAFLVCGAVKVIKVMSAIVIAFMVLNTSKSVQAQVKNDFPIPLLKGGPSQNSFILIN
jgi:hypothetical protein